MTEPPPAPADVVPAAPAGPPGSVDRIVTGAVGWLPVALVLGGVAIVFRLAARPINDPDVWWHLRLGDDLWSQGSLRAPGDWSPRASVAWVPSEPLPEVVAARFEAWWGLPSLAWLYGATMLVVVLVLYAVCRTRAGAMAAALTVLMATLAMSGSLSPRPQLISFVLIPLVLLAWDRAGLTLRPPWWLVPLTWFWSMCHGFWIVGVGLSGLCWCGLVLDRRPAVPDAVRLAVVPVASFLVVLLNPAGWDVALAPLSVNDTAQYIAEWGRTTLRFAPAVVCLILIVALASLLAWRRHVTWTELLLLAAAAFFWWYALRTVAVAAVVVAPLLARRLGEVVPPRPAEPTPRREGWLLGLSSVVVLALLAVVVPRTSTEPAGVPSGLAPELDRLPAGTPIFNTYAWGGWLAWRHPDLDRTSDGLVVPYDPDYIGDLARVEKTSGPWETILADLRVDYALLESDSDLTSSLQDRGWRTVAESRGAVLLSAPEVVFPAG